MRLTLLLTYIANVVLMWSPPLGAEGYDPDVEECRKALRAVVEFSCKEFAWYGISIDPSRLNYGDHEVVDSFLKGRECYRAGNGQEIPLEPKLARLVEIFGDRYPEYEARWRQKVEEYRAHPRRPLSKEEIVRRLDVLKELGPSPVKMQSGMCRSSSGFVAVDVECIHCGRHIVYSKLDESYHDKPPAFYKKVAEELGRLGIKVEVDGRAVCPECCPYLCDFKLGEFEYKVRFKDDIDWSNAQNSYFNDSRVRALRGKQLLTVARKTDRFYAVTGVFKEAWLLDGDNELNNGIYEKPGEGFLCGKGEAPIITLAEPRKEVTVANKGTFVKIMDFAYKRNVFVPTSMVDVVTIVKASNLRDIPPTMFIVNGNRFPASEHRAQILLAFAKEYSTFYEGEFNDHYAVARSEEWLRKLFLGGFATPAPHVIATPSTEGEGVRMRWEFDQKWYFNTFLPGIKTELDKIDPNAKDMTVAYEPASKPEMLYEGPVAGFAGAVKWNLFGATPDKWDVDMEFGICQIWGKGPCRHFVVLVTSLGESGKAGYRVYEITGSNTYEFWRKVSGELDCKDKSFSAMGEFWAKDQVGADVLVITPWLRRGTAHFVFTR